MGAFASKSVTSQSFNIPPPTFTEASLPDQTGKVILITGGYTGLGQELSRFLYQHNAKIYIAGRDASKGQISIAATKALFPNSKGSIEFLLLDLADLTTIKKCANEFLEKEVRLDVLVLNAGLMFPPEGEKSVQGHEIQMGVCVLGHFLLAELLVPILTTTSAISPKNSVRTIWPSSVGIEVFGPQGGITFTDSNIPKLFKGSGLKSQQINYAQAKAGNLFLANEFRMRYGIASVAFNPGNLNTGIQRHSKGLEAVVQKWFVFPAIYGAYTELWAGWGEVGDGERWYVVPWGKNGYEGMRKDIREAMVNGGAGDKLWEWCIEETKKYR